jgi:hypothetical protein
MMSEGLTLPLGWCCTSLEKIATWGSGGTPSRNIERYFQGTIPWIKTGELGSMYIRDATSEFIIEESSRKFLNSTRPLQLNCIFSSKGDILALHVWRSDWVSCRFPPELMY